MPLLTKPYTILSPGEALEADTVCQEGIQASANLSYAALLIRRRSFEAARHLLDSLEKSKSAPPGGIPSILRIWVNLETGDFSRAKTELLDRLRKQPADSLSLSLLQACMVLELERQKETATGSGALRKAAEEVASAAAALAAPRPPASPPPPVEVVEQSKAAEPVPKITPAPAPKHEPESSPEPVTTAPKPPPTPADETGAHGISDDELAAYQTVLSDPQAYALQLWNGSGQHRLIEKAEGFAVPGGLAEWMRSELPGGVAEPVTRLEGGEIRKILFSFQNLAVSTWHAGARNAGLVTGPMAPAMITWVRTDKLFQKQTKATAENPK